MIFRSLIIFPFLWGVALDKYPITTQTINSIEQEMKIVPSIILFFLQWPSSPNNGEFPKNSLNSIWDQGAIPVLTWEPMFYEHKIENMIHFQDILNGKYDSYLKMFAQGSIAFGNPFIIRFAHEMNLSRYHWGTNDKEYNEKSPEIYIKMFRYIVSLFRKEGANKVLFAFCPNAESVPSTSWNAIKNYYPGDDYVNILGMDGYNWGTTQTVEKNGWKSNWKSFDEIFLQVYKDLKLISKTKPLLIFETSSANLGGIKRDWFKNAIDTVQKWEVQGIVWFQVNKEIDWRINTEIDTFYSSILRNLISPSQAWIKNIK
ncbi:MAG: endoglucanase [Desulfobacterales bacterium]|nr:endoglucanase [Desulfobacterales bacterium]MBF0397292.1 endoglucanase [Desulfobacterales bacterium]